MSQQQLSALYLSIIKKMQDGQTIRIIPVSRTGFQISSTVNGIHPIPSSAINRLSELNLIKIKGIEYILTPEGQQINTTAK